MKKILSLFLTLTMIICMISLPVYGAEPAPLPVDNNVIDITDKTVYSLSSYYAKAINISVGGGVVEEAYESGTNVDILLADTTDPSAEISVEFGTQLNRCSMSGHTGTVTLENGQAQLVLTLKGYYSSASSLNGTATYTLNFSVAAAPDSVPECKIESDYISTYNGIAVSFNLKDYFSAAKEYYLTENGENTLLDSNIYTFSSDEGGVFTLVFTASNENGFCDGTVTITIEVTEIQSGMWLDITTSNGSVNYVIFTDSKGNKIDGIDVGIEGTYINVTLPRSYGFNDKVTATFDLTQNSGLPKLSTNNDYRYSNNTTVFNTTLSNGMGKATMYLYNENPKATSNKYTTYTINYAIDNEIPKLAEGQNKTHTDTAFAGAEYTVDLSNVFVDPEGDELTYSVKVNGENAVAIDNPYTFTPTVGGTYTLEFFASDNMSTSEEAYTVTLDVKNSDVTYDMSVLLPDYINPEFYITNGYDANGTDIIGDALTFTAGEVLDGYTPYTVYVPENISEISVRDSVYGGMSVPAAKETAVTLKGVTAQITDIGGRNIAGNISVTYNGRKLTGVDNKFLLVADAQYTFSATPSDTSAYNSASKTVDLNEDTVTITVAYKNPKTIVTTIGAEVKLFKFSNNYFVHTMYTPLATVDNGDGTSTHYFNAEGDLSYRVTMEGKITKAGYLTRNSATVLHSDADPLPTDRADYTLLGTDASMVADDSLLLNINQQNHLSLNIGDKKTVKAYRAWEIINNYMNHIIKPDFNFNIIYGDDVVSLVPYENQPMVNSSGNWYTLTANNEGTAVIEVTYNAMVIEGGSYSGFYGATDSARTGLFVVTSGIEVADVDFGIKSKTSAGSIVYKESNAKSWDSEFDTLYFFGESGEIKLSPTAKDANITEVAVSADKGINYTVIEATDGEYSAPIYPGNNIVRVTTDKGVAYQVIRGDKIELFVKNITNPGKPVSAGDTVSLKLIGVHTPVPKISGTFNPGYTANTDGESKVHLNYTFGETSVLSQGKQYDFSLNGTTLEFTLPTDSEETEFKLTDGYIGVGVIGVTGFSDDGDSHRNIPDSGSGTRASETTFTTRSILPDITVSAGMLPSDNLAPFIRENAPKTASLNLGGTYAVSMSRIFTDRDDDTLTYTAKVGENEAVTIEDYYTFTPDKEGTYTIVFVANDGSLESDPHTLILTVKEKETSSSPSSSELKFDISEDEIEGYVTVSFTDNGKRDETEKNIKYPKALGTIISAKKVPFKKDDTVADVTIRLLDAMGYTYEYTGTTKKGFYLASIGDFTQKGIKYDYFGEFDAGSGSGWMITLNKTFIEYGASEFEVKNGDIIKWQYTCQLGADIGDPFYSGSGSSSSDNVQKKDEPQKEQTEDTTDDKITNRAELFTDVKSDDWHYEYVKYVYENNLMQGTGKGFEPDSNMTRAMLVTVIYRMSGDTVNKDTTKFDDVSADEWYTDAVLWATQNNIVNGVSDQKFAPDENITREQMALIIYRYAKMQGYDVNPKADISSFKDADDTSDWAVDAISWAISKGIINGTSKDSLSPQSTATRAQIAAIIMRFCTSNN